MKFYDTIYAIFHRPLKALFRVSVTGLENVPEKEGFLLCANHTSFFDVIVLAASLPRRPKYMAKKELFKVPFLAPLIRAFGAFPVERGGADVSAIKKAVSLIEEGQVVSMFPQGHRVSGKPARGSGLKNGAGMIAYRAGCGILPVYIKTKAYRVKFFRKTEIIIGKFITNAELGFDHGGTEEYAGAASCVFDRICELGEPTSSCSESGEKQ